jgi:hypothetical protein
MPNSRVEVFVLNEFVTDPSEVGDRRSDRLKKLSPKKPMRQKIGGVTNPAAKGIAAEGA